MQPLGLGFHLHRLSWLTHASIVETKLRHLARAVKAGFDPNQPRVPAGSGRISGRWTDGGGDGGTQVGQIAPRAGGSGAYRLRSGRAVEPTPARQARLVASEAESARLRRQVQEIDPAWKPSESLTPDSIEGDIAAAEGEANEARERLFELAKQLPQDLMDAYRRQQGLDLLDEPVWSREQNTVATCKLGEIPLIGVNSGALTYPAGDEAAAIRLRTSMTKLSGPVDCRQCGSDAEQRIIPC